MPTMVGPADGTLGALGALLHYAFYVERDPKGVVAAAYRKSMTSFVTEIEEAGLTEAVLGLKAERSELVDVLALFD